MRETKKQMNDDADETRERESERERESKAVDAYCASVLGAPSSGPNINQS